MASVAAKKYSGQTGDLKTANSDRREEPYVVTGATSPADAVDAAIAEAAALGETSITEGGSTLYIVSASHDFISQTPDGTSQNYGVTLHYGPISYQRLDFGDVRVTYDTAGGTFHTTLAKTETVYDEHGLVSGTNTVSFNMIVGNQVDSADGCDIPISDFHMTVTVVFDLNAATGAPNAMPDHNDLFRLTGRTNNADFAVKDTRKNRTYSFLAGELTFEGAGEPDARPDGGVEMTFRFHGSPNVVNQTIGPITGVDKKGSEYLWVRYEIMDNPGAKKISAFTPKYAVVNQVLFNDDFSLLNIPVP
jgi:hypothetical protein